jgi:hypothetical protein
MPDSPGPPDFFTVEEAARILRIGRTAAYELTRRWRATGGREGLPVVLFGRLLRVPRAALEEISGGPLATGSSVVAEKQKPAIVDPTDIAVTPPSPALPVSAVHRRSRKHSRPRPITKGQSTLPFS